MVHPRKKPIDYLFSTKWSGLKLCMLLALYEVNRP